MSFDPGTTTAIVPLRTGGKTRLASALAVRERAALSGAMLADVAAALEDAGIGRVIVAAEGPSAVAAAGALNLEVVRDEPGARGLDDALRHAALRVAPRQALLIVAADLPRLTAVEVERLLGGSAPVVVAPTSDGGTGGLLRCPVGVIPTAYGPGSADRHLRLARAAGVGAELVRTVGFEHDVDHAADLWGLRGTTVGRATAQVLESLDLERRAAG